MDIEICGFDNAHLLGGRATYSPRHAALFVLAGGSPPRPHALPDTPITALAGAFNYRL
jgi:hypothetical protein